MAKQADGGNRLLADNRKARFNYTVEEEIECGIALHGTEVKSLKSARFSFTDAYARIKGDELWLIGFHISPYPFGSLFNHDPDRVRKLLVHKQELQRLKRKTDEKGYTLVPLRVYMRRGIIKLALGICVGKKLFDKRETIKSRDQMREAQREIRQGM